MVERLFLAVPQGCLQFVIVVFPDHTHLLFWIAVYSVNLKSKHQIKQRNFNFIKLIKHV